MSGTVVPLFKEQPPADPGCACRPAHLCYPHRLTNAADLLRAEVAAARAADWLTPTSEVERMARDVLAVLDEIASECLPDERTAP